MVKMKIWVLLGNQFNETKFSYFFLNKEVRNIDKSFYTIQNLKVGFVQAKQNIQKITILNVTILDQLMSYYIHDFQIWRHIVFILSIFSKSMALVCQMSNSTDLNVCLLYIQDFCVSNKVHLVKQLVSEIRCNFKKLRL